MLLPSEGQTAESVESVAEQLGKRPSTLYAWVDNIESLPVMQVVRLTRIKRSPALIQALNDMCDFDGHARAKGRDIMGEIVPDMLSEFAAVVEATAAAMTDNHVSKEEVERAEVAAEHAIGKVRDLVAEMHKRASERHVIDGRFQRLADTAKEGMSRT